VPNSSSKVEFFFTNKQRGKKDNEQGGIAGYVKKCAEFE
jgi:hypothetical protein